MEHKKNNNHIYVLHLSDLHFSKKIQEDMDMKTSVKVNSHSEKIDKFKEYIRNLPVKPDYVVVSGDITTRGELDGFEMFNNIVRELIRKKKLPSIDNFVVVPGNHDVKAGDSMEDRARWNDFRKTIGSIYLIPWIKDAGAEYDSMISLVDKELSKGKSVQGGRIVNVKTREYSSLPFLLDKEKKVLFYAFNSALLSHTKLDDPEAKELISSAKKYNGDNKKMIDLADKLEKEMSIDPARIVEDELILFTYCMKKIKGILQEDYDSFIKIAVLHHHIAPIACSEEIKKFELLINAGKFKKSLIEQGFQMVLHGHKHWNEIYLDTAISGGGALLVVSGGTICGMTNSDRKAGFYLLDFSVEEKTVKPCYFEMNSSYENILDKKANKVFHLDMANKNIGVVDEREHYNLKELFQRVEETLLDNIKRNENEELCGWRSMLNIRWDGKIGVIATAYGLIIASMLKMNTLSYIQERSKIVNTLWGLRLEGGGFKALSQPEKPAIEATVWALRAFYYVGDIPKFETTLGDLNDLLEKNPLSEESSITTLTLVMDVLCECQPKSEKIASIKEIIMRKACYSEENRILYWPNPQIGNGSAIYTALAIISLTNYAKINDELPQMVSELQVCGEWLIKAKWENVRERIRRVIKVNVVEKLGYNHYTAPWGIMALLRLGYDKGEKKIIEEMKRMLDKEENGTWRWNDDEDCPIWAIYNVISVINEFVLSDIGL